MRVVILLLIVLAFDTREGLAEVTEVAALFPGDDDSFYEGGAGDIIYSATKTPKRLVQAPAIATVITAEEIRNMGATTLGDVLKRIPGVVMLTAKDAAVGYDSIETRGVGTFSGEKILIMIDGHRVNNLISGGATWLFHLMFVENIKRVEFIRGPGSALHGTSAFMASINIVTKDTTDLDGVVAMAGTGSLDYRHANLLFGKEFSDLKLSGSFNYKTRGSPDLEVESDAIGRSGATDDWFRVYDLALKAEYGDFSFKTDYFHKNEGSLMGVADALNDGTDIEHSHFYSELSYLKNIGENSSVLMKLYADRFFHNPYWVAFDPGAIPQFPYGFKAWPPSKDKTYGAEVQFDYNVTDNNNVTFGAMYEEKGQYDVAHLVNVDPVTGENFPEIVDYTERANWSQNASRTIYAIYVQDIWRITPELEGTFGARFDHYSDFGESLNPRAAIVWNFMENTNLKLLYGSAFRAPNYEELYNINNPVHLGNIDLSPEKIDTYEASVDYFPRDLQVKLTYFHSEIRDIIRWDLVNATNLGKWRIDGVEFEAKKTFDNLADYCYLNFTLLDPRDADTGESLPDVAKQYGNMGFNWAATGHLNLNSNLLMVGARERSETDTRSDLSGYKVVDVSVVAKDFYKTAEIRASIHNLLDEEYSDPAPEGTVASDYPREGVTFSVDVSYRF